MTDGASTRLVLWWLFVAFVLAAMLGWVAGYSPSQVGAGMIRGAVTAPGALTSSARWTVPLVLIGVGVVVSFRAGYFNVGALGQMYLGATAAAAVGLALRDGPWWLVTPLSLAAGVGAGAAWSLLAGWLRLAYGADELLVTLMLNFLAKLLLQYVTGGPLRNPTTGGAVASSERIPDSFRLSGSSGVSWAMVAIVAVVVVAIGVVVSRTRVGFIARLLGRNPEMLRWQGAEPAAIGVPAFALAGATAGLAGALEVFGPAGRLTAGFAPTVGFDALVVVLVGSVTVVGVVLVGFLFGGLRAAAIYLPIGADVPRSVVDTLNGLIALVITAGVMPSMARARRRRRRAERRAEQQVVTA